MRLQARSIGESDFTLLSSSPAGFVKKEKILFFSL
jgi:hypothetical protein